MATRINGVVAKNGTFSNPFREGSNYHACLSAILILGKGKAHSIDKAVAEAKKQMGQGWKEFSKKEARNEETGKDATARLIQNFSLTGHLDYGAAVIEQGYRVIFNGREKTVGLFALKAAKAPSKPKAAAKKTAKPTAKKVSK